MSEFFKPEDFAAVLPDLRYGGFSDNSPLREGATAAVHSWADTLRSALDRLAAEGT